MIYLDEDVIEAYNNYEIDEIDILNLYEHELISEELIEEILEKGILDDFITENFELNLELINESKFKKFLKGAGNLISTTAGTIGGSIIGGPAGAIIGGKLAQGTFHGITDYIKKKKEERDARRAAKIQKNSVEHETKTMSHTDSNGHTINYNETKKKTQNNNDKPKIDREVSITTNKPKEN